MEKLSHFVFDGEKIMISGSLSELFEFLGKIEEEIKVMLFYKENMKDIKDRFHIIFDDFAQCVKKLEALGEQQPLKSKKEMLASLLKDITDYQDVNVRPVMIALFSYMETIFCVRTIYDHDITTDNDAIRTTKDNLSQLIKKYLITQDNPYYKDHQDRLEVITSNDLKKLRNYLTHFYAVTDKIGISQNGVGGSRELAEAHMKGIGKIFRMITPEEFYERLSGAVHIMFSERTQDTHANQEVFTKKMENVLNIVVKHAPKMMMPNPDR